MSSYQELVKCLTRLNILDKWTDVTPVENISGVPIDAGSTSAHENVFEGHDEEQIRLMEELCIVLDYEDHPIGAGTKKLCHLMSNINRGLLHRAFSVFLFNEDGKLMLQQRADEKITFPNMWTNTCCSHPLCVPSELGIKDNKSNKNELETAVAGVKLAAQRKLYHELGISEQDCPVSSFQFLTRIHYKSASGDEASEWGEHEIDYILILRAKNNIKVEPSLNEVKDFMYVSVDELKVMFEDKNLQFTPWFKLICETFLFQWWADLKNIEQFEDKKIHRLL
ncbi:Isopentenyldiphosphate isomerase [Metschnikowia bicuspidata var. bicuspidata NRRL YB-4993]|uniref:Isopentenyl-diphosphate Delta-isomerase n=1 Tax=Metschnikowia bicuspidata var. bicuspidata NRRL YB-4993 TaxID=869754 RepID=A0A1A0HDY1_9ASCO|nr:Isopentenyldiphosphate isomerase [Metschnikowia bicuspidata var. bicuspidata NRRL YB-4993]OBA22221.1 Isopentenyldiphosphate isomerase [Metschnikowia bicuspidata var. bicuspidata NRRL YB-4993]